MKKKFVLFSAGAVVVAGALIYVLGVYPPTSTRDAQGAIGQREVYRDPQARDAAVTPVLTTLKHFRAEYEAHIREGRCTLPADWRARHQPVGAH